MENNLKKAFQNNVEIPNNDLAQNVWHGIARAERRSDRRALLGYGLLSFTLLAVIVPVFKDLAVQFSQSGFGEYLSLALSGGAVASYWKELMLSLAESLPAWGIAICLTLVALLFGSLRAVVRHVKIKNKLQTI